MLAADLRPRRATAFIVLFALAVFVECSYAGGEGSVPKEQCPEKCSFRCSKTSHRNDCMFFCGHCCERCLCVPSGTYGNKEECPCYNNMKTQEGKPKCP